MSYFSERLMFVSIFVEKYYNITFVKCSTLIYVPFNPFNY